MRILAFIMPALLAVAGASGAAAAAPEAPAPAPKPVWSPDRGDGTYQNPIICADYSDPDVVRVGDDFYLTASSFGCIPGLPILHSRDLVNWTIVGHAFDHHPFAQFDVPQHSNGIWAPSLRFHNGEFYIFVGDPDLGIFMTKTKNPAGPWEPLRRIRESRGWIDTCPFWDDDGQAYLVHAFAKSRAGINSILTLNRMSPDGTRLLDEGKMIVDGRGEKFPTLEGPKMYKRNGYYYIMAPAGGVAPGYQLAFRSKNIYGPYEDKVVLAQGATPTNGPHQGGWVETQTGQSWFIHFQDRDAYGRVVHLEPVKWVDDWPLMGVNQDAAGKGEPVLTYKKPDVGRSWPAAVPQTGDEFEGGKLGLQWQWQANPRPQWASLEARPGWLRLAAVAPPAGATNLWPAPNLLVQKLPAPAFTVTARLELGALGAGGKAGLIMNGTDYAYIAAEHTPGAAGAGYRILKAACRNANTTGTVEAIEGENPLAGPAVYLRLQVNPGAVCTFSFSADGNQFTSLGRPFTARKEQWIGAKVGLFCLAGDEKKPGCVDVDWFRVE